MSAPDNFVDWYEVLEISPNAHVETVSRVYRLLAQRYHPDNPETGDQERFSMILNAHRVLSDPEARARFDVQHQQQKALKWQMFDAKKAAGGVGSDREVRFALLGLLYAKRRRDPSRASVPLFEIETMLGIPREHLEFPFWYLRERGMIIRNDDGSCMITANGVEYLDEQGLEERAQSLAGLPVGGGR